MRERDQAYLLGRLAGDSLGGPVEFRAPDDIRREYPNGVHELTDGGTCNTIAVQPTDDSEMALALARMLTEHGRCDPMEAGKAHIFRLGPEQNGKWWLNEPKSFTQSHKDFVSSLSQC